MSGFTVQTRIFGEGERRALLVAEDGRLDWYSTLYITLNYRNVGSSHNTQSSVLDAIRALLLWSGKQKPPIDLAGRFRAKEWLDEVEVDRLIEFLRVKVAKRAPLSVEASSSSRQLKSRKRPPAVLVSKGIYTRLTYVALYLQWLAEQLNRGPSRRPSASDHMRMVQRVLHKRPPVSKARSVSRKKGLEPEEVEWLFETLRPDSPTNPFEENVRFRNFLIFVLLIVLGVRGGELLALKISDFNFEHENVDIVRRHDDPSDPRTYQPVVKTLGRLLPLQPELCDLVFEYINQHRSKIKPAKKHPFLLVTHREGPHFGKPLSSKGLYKIFKTILKNRKDMKSFHPHRLRHTANDYISELADSQKISPANERKLRSFLMGWTQTSLSAATYTERYIERSANELSLKLQRQFLQPHIKGN